VDAFEAAGAETVVVNAAGCGAVMKEYGELLAGDEAYAERAARLAERVRDVSEVLAEAGPVRGAALPVEVTYDAPCHLLHAQRVSEAPLAVLAAVPGLVVRALEGADECCGGAGIYGLTHVELGGRIGRDKADAVRRTGAEVVVTGNPGCAMQIGAWLRTAADRPDVAHPVELLDESYRRAGFYHGRGRG
jgi:glycolate oxidase iron-sulfur subunit